jgi:hypothetical protein
MSIMKSRQQEFSQKAHEEHRRCCDWLLRFMKNKHPKFLTKSELRAAAIRKFNMSKNSFDFAWIDAIEEAGRHEAQNNTQSIITDPDTVTRFSAELVAEHMIAQRQSARALGIHEGVRNAKG